MVEMLLANGDGSIREENTKQTILHIAVANNKPKLVELILKTSPELVYTQDVEGRTPLHLAAEASNITIGRLLVNAGANVDAVDKNQESPLHTAASVGSLEFAQFLVENKANPQLKQRDGSQPGTVII